VFEEVPLSLLASLFGFLSQDLAIDLGTANTLVYVRGKGIVINEPSIVAIDQKTDQILAIGHEAKKMLGRTPGNIVAVRPMRNGVIDNPDVTQQMLSYFINQVHQRSTFVRPRMVVCIPSRISQVEQRAVKDSARLAGAREVYLIEEPLAAAIGAGLPIMEPSGNMVIDIGGGTTDIAVISLGGIVYSESIKVAGDQMDEDIIHYIRKKHNLLIGDAMGERIKMEVGSACAQNEPRSMDQGQGSRTRIAQDTEGDG
jgi:rod shape-determining protein MreB